MSEVVQCDVCEAIVDPLAPRALYEAAWIAVDNGGPRRQHVCSPNCLAVLAVRMGADGPKWTDETVEQFARQFAATEQAARAAGRAAAAIATAEPTAPPAPTEGRPAAEGGGA